MKDRASRFIEKSIAKGQVEHVGTELDGLLSPVSRCDSNREWKKQTVLENTNQLVEGVIGI